MQSPRLGEVAGKRPARRTQESNIILRVSLGMSMADSSLPYQFQWHSPSALSHQQLLMDGSHRTQSDSSHRSGCRGAKAADYVVVNLAKPTLQTIEQQALVGSRCLDTIGTPGLTPSSTDLPLRSSLLQPVSSDWKERLESPAGDRCQTGGGRYGGSDALYHWASINHVEGLERWPRPIKENPPALTETLIKGPVGCGRRGSMRGQVQTVAQASTPPFWEGELQMWCRSPPLNVRKLPRHAR